MDKRHACLSACIIVPLDIADINCPVQSVPFTYQCNIISFCKPVISITLNILKQVMKLVIIQKCFNIPRLAVAYNI